MSYRFALGRPAPGKSPKDAISSGSLVPLGTTAKVKTALEAIVHPIAWAPGSAAVATGSYQSGDTWYEFSLHSDPVIAISISTSLRATSRHEIRRICEGLEVYALDMQTWEVAGSPSDAGKRPMNPADTNG